MEFMLEQMGLLAIYTPGGNHPAGGKQVENPLFGPMQPISAIQWETGFRVQQPFYMKLCSKHAAAESAESTESSPGSVHGMVDSANRSRKYRSTEWVLQHGLIQADMQCNTMYRPWILSDQQGP